MSLTASYSSCGVWKDEARLPPSVAISIQFILDFPQVRQLILFGSRAVGDHDERSDFDIAVSAPDFEKCDMVEIRVRLSNAPSLYQISVTHLEGMPTKLQTRVIQQGVVIYERQKAAR